MSAEATEVVDDGITAEGRTSTELDAAIQLKFDRAKRLITNDKNYDEAADILSDLLSESTEKYGQLAPVVAPIYFHYGDVLLRSIEAKAQALAQTEEGDADEADDAEDGGEADAPAAENEEEATNENVEEDITKEDDDDETIAFESLDVARVIYSRITPATPEVELELARVHLRLGDLYSEGDKFSEALNEYKECLAIRSKHLEKHDRRLADVLSSISTAYIQMASTKEIEEKVRKQHLSNALIHTQAAAECLALAAINKATSLASAEVSKQVRDAARAFSHALEQEITAGALQYTYPAGRTESVAALTAPSSTKAPVASNGDGKPPAEPEIVVFTTAFQRYLKDFATNDDTSSIKVEESAIKEIEVLQELSEITDALLQRMTDITADLGISINKLMNDIAAAAGIGTTTIGFGTAAATAPADASAATLAPRKKEGSSPARPHVSGVKRKAEDVAEGGEPAKIAKTAE